MQLRRLMFFGICWSLAMSPACAPPSGTAPATAPEKPKVEIDLSLTTLSEDECQSLGIRTGSALRKNVQDSIAVSGWIMVKPGNEVAITAPVSGHLRLSTGNNGIPIVGRAIKRGEQLFALEPVLTPVEQIQLASLKRTMDTDLAKARENEALASKELERCRELHKQKLRGDQDLEQALSKFKHAQEDLASAEDKRKLFVETTADSAMPQLRALAITAPRAGTVLTLHASPGQYVAAAAPLITLADLTELWVRVPIPEHYLSRVDRTQNAVLDLPVGNGKNGHQISLKPVSFIPQVDLLRHTADMVYEIKPVPSGWPSAKDQMVSMHVPLGEKCEECLVPYSAVIYDAYAGTWIYVDKTPADSKMRVYERRRVELGSSTDDQVVIRPSCQSGDKVVSHGAAALFSREFHKPPQRPAGNSATK